MLGHLRGAVIPGIAGSRFHPKGARQCHRLLFLLAFAVALGKTGRIEEERIIPCNGYHPSESQCNALYES